MNTPPMLDRKYIKRREAEKFWQFQYEFDPIKESKTFYDKNHGSKEAALAAAQEHRDKFLAAAHELGLAAADGTREYDALPIRLTLSARNKSGIVGLYRESLERKHLTAPEMNWIAGYKEGGKQKQKGFSVRAFGEKGALLKALQFRRGYVELVAEQLTSQEHKKLVRRNAEELAELEAYIQELDEKDELYFFLGTLNNPAISPTEKNAELAVRIGQSRFRKLVMAMWNGRCAVTGASHFLVASHIKPWSQSSDIERLDPHNGIALSPVYDRAFDAGFISFMSDGAILLSSALTGR